MANVLATLQELSKPEEEEQPQLSVADTLSKLQAEKAAVTDQELPVDTSPLPVDPERAVPNMGQNNPMGIPAPVTLHTKDERSDAARGVDIHSDLGNFSLRKALGFSPNEAFSADFLRRQLAEKTGIPEHQVLRQNERGGFEWLNPETNRYTPVDSTAITKEDLADLYGPATTIVPAVASAIVGGVFGGPWSADAAGAFGAFAGEGWRLKHGKELGVHDLSTHEMFWEAMSAGKTDLVWGVGGHLTVKLKQFWNGVFRPQPFQPDEAAKILESVGKNKALVEDINQTLELAGRPSRFKLDPVADADSALGLEQREAAAKLTNRAKAQRAEEIAANTDALEDFARIDMGIQDLETRILTNEGAATAAKPASTALRAERQRIQEVANTNMRTAEKAAGDALDNYRNLDRNTSVQEARDMVVLHADGLKTAKDSAWEGYQQAIGQAPEGLTSSVQIPVTPEVAAAHARARMVRKGSTLTKAAKGSEAIKPLKVGDTVDLAVLDEDIKTLRAITRDKVPQFRDLNTIASQKRLVEMRNSYLLETDPLTLDLLEKAEQATTIHSNFVHESVFADIIKTDRLGNLVLDNVDSFKRIFQSDTGEAMRQLVTVAEKHPGGVAELQNTFLKLYRANVIPEGSQFPSLALHNGFISSHADTIGALFPDKKLLQFGQVAKNIERTVTRARAVRSGLANSALGRIAGANPEAMGAVVFKGNIAEDGLRVTMSRLKQASPEASTSFTDSVGREVYRRITTDGAVSPAKIKTLLETQAGKLNIVFGRGYSDRLSMLARAIELNLKTETGKQLETSTLIGRMSRAILTPPLTKRGRVQTLFEKIRVEAGSRLIGEAVRSEDVLRQIVLNGTKDIRNEKVVSLLAANGALALALDQDL